LFDQNKRLIFVIKERENQF